MVRSAAWRANDGAQMWSQKVGRALSYPLNPVDNALLATHESLRWRGYCGLSVMLIAELEGELDPTEMRAAVRQLGLRYPVLSAHIRYTPLLRRAYRNITPDAPLAEAIEYEHHPAGDGQQDGWALLQRALGDSVDLSRGSQVRLVHVESGKGRHLVGLRWAHPLMDFEGGHMLFKELHAALCGQPATLAGEPGVAERRPYDWRFPGSLLRVWQGRLRYARLQRFHQPRLVGKPELQHKKCNFLVRTFGAARRSRFEELAKHRCSAGPLLYSRAMMVGVALTYLRMATQRGRPRDRLIFSQPLPIPRQGSRPSIQGNYVTTPCVAFLASELADWATADAAVVRNFKEYRQESHDEAMWEMYRATQRWPLPWVRMLVTHRIPRVASYCTGYRFGGDTTHLGRARIINLCGSGPPNCHPGWLVGFTTFGEGMTISITFFEDYVDRQTARDFLHDLEAEILGLTEDQSENTS